jgi:8-oxo-dGTP pyrophosphatase MutT (NUDIX family)
MKRSAGIIPFIRTPAGPQFLILRSYSYWDFPKGAVEPGEAPQAAALRELQEETGLSQASLVGEDLFIETEPYARGKVSRYYLAQVNPQEEVKLLPNPVSGIREHHEYRWVSYPEALALFVPRLQTVLNWAIKLLPD